MLNSKYDDAYGLREIYRIQGIKLGYGRAVAIMRPPARINTAPRPNECGRPPESAYLGIRSLLHRHFLQSLIILNIFGFSLIPFIMLVKTRNILRATPEQTGSNPMVRHS